MSGKCILKKSVLIFFSSTDTIKCGTNQMNAGDNVVSIYLSKTNTALNNNLEKLNRICALKDNWDGYGAKTLPEGLITKAGELIRELQVQPEIFPTADGTIQIEYEKDNGDYLEFQFSGNGTCEVFRRMNGKEEYFNALDDYSSINALTEAFYG